MKHFSTNHAASYRCIRYAVCWFVFIFSLAGFGIDTARADALYTARPVTTNLSGEVIAYANSGRKVAISKSGTIFVALRGSSGIRVVRSTDRGYTFSSPVQITTETDECEILADDAGRVFVVWVHNGIIRLSRSSNSGVSFSSPVNIGTANSAARIATSSPYVYIIANQGTHYYRNSADGAGTFTSNRLPGDGIFADVFASPLSDGIFFYLDFPYESKSLFLQSSSGSPTVFQTNVIARDIKYPTAGASFTSGGSYLLAAGNNDVLTQINADTAQQNETTVQSANDRQRSLASDELGNVLNAEICNLGTLYSVSTNQGSSFGTAVKVGGQVDSMTAGINSLYGDIVLVYQDSGRVFCNTYANELVNSNVELIVTTTSDHPQYRPGADVVYTIDITNKNATATSVVVSNEIPFYVTYTGGSDGWQTIDDKHHYYEISSLDKNEGRQLTITGRVEMTAAGPMVCKTTIHSAQLDMFPANNTNLYTTYVSGSFEVRSDHGTPIPAVGFYTNDYGQRVTNSVDSPVVNGNYQYVNTGWTLSGNTPTSGSSNRFVMVQTNDATLVWQWGTTNVSLSLSHSGSGTITGNTQKWAAINTSLRLDATPALHYHFVKWTGDVPSGQESNATLFPYMDQPRSLAAQFSIDQHTLTVQSSAAASVSPSAGSHNYSYGSSLTATCPSTYEITQQTQYLCTGWSLIGNNPTSGSGISTPITLTNNATLRWHWGTTNVYLNVGSDSYGHVSGPSTGWVLRNGVQTLTAVEDDFSHFTGWSGDVPASQTNNYTISLTMDRTRQVYAHFSIEQRDVTVASTYGSPNPTVGTHTYNCLQSVTPQVNTPISDGSYTQYACKGWIMSGQAPLSGSGHQFTMSVTNNASLRWLWQTNVRFTASVDGPGSIGGPGTGWYQLNSSITVTAVPHSYARFIGWSGSIPSGSTNNNPLTISLTSTKNVTAHFYRDPITLRVISPYGTTWPPVGTTTNYMGQYLSLNCPSSLEVGTTQYVCTGWAMSGNQPASGSTYEFSMTQTNNAQLTWKWGQTNVLLSIETNGHGSVTGAKAGYYPLGSAITVTAQTITGGQFLYWDKDVPSASTNNTSVVLTMNRARTVRAHFSTVQRTLSVQSSYGSPTPAVGSHTYVHGTRVSASVPSPITISSTEQMRCTGFTFTGNAPAGGTATSTSITLTNDATLRWNWASYYYMNITSDAHGSVSGGTGWQKLGTSITYTPTPSQGYRFSSWSGDIPPSNRYDNPLVISVDRARAFEAQFEEFHPTLTMLSSPYGTSDPVAGIHTNDYGQILTNTLSGSPVSLTDTQLVCSGWTMPGNAPVSGLTTSCVFTATNHTTFSWLWQTNVALRWITNGMGSISGPTNTWPKQGSIIELTATASNGYTFAGWSGTVPSSRTNDNPLYLTMDHSHSVTALFDTAQLQLEVRSAHGIPTPSIGMHTNLYGLLLSNSVSATAPGGVGTQYASLGWTMTGNSPVSGSSHVFTMNQTNNATLTWLWRTNVLLSATPTVGGTITGSATGWYARGSSVSLSAVASSNYEFDCWAGDLGAAGSNSASISLSMTQARTLEAKFKLKLVIDFALYGISVHSSPDRDSIDAVIQVCNQGSDAGDGGNMTLWVNRSTQATCGESGNTNYTIGHFDAGEIRTFTITNLYPGAGTGIRRLLVYVDSECDTIETDEDNNQFDVEYNYLGPVYDEFSFTAFALTNQVMLRWTQPTLCGVATDRVMIRYKSDAYPGAYNDGTELYQGTNTATQHNNVTIDQTYYYTIWCSDGTYWITPPEY
ncbi:MAG: hypothetical protein EOL87_02715 [Spartobacteria bacterium]|nr:hypothetical protein [Spartobacteria bacterium]